MNPATILRLWKVWDSIPRDNLKPAHILYIGAIAGTWPATVYKAEWYGYLRKTESAYFIPTQKMLTEVERAKKLGVLI